MSKDKHQQQKDQAGQSTHQQQAHPEKRSPGEDSTDRAAELGDVRGPEVARLQATGQAAATADKPFSGDETLTAGQGGGQSQRERQRAQPDKRVFADQGRPPEEGTDDDATSQAAEFGDARPPLVAKQQARKQEGRGEPSADETKAVLIERDQNIICRPPPGIPSAALGDVVIGNWVGRYKNKSVRVAHCTPLNGLPSELVEAIRKTDGQRVGPFPPPPTPEEQRFAPPPAPAQRAAARR